MAKMMTKKPNDKRVLHVYVYKVRLCLLISTIAIQLPPCRTSSYYQCERPWSLIAASMYVGCLIQQFPMFTVSTSVYRLKRISNCLPSFCYILGKGFGEKYN